VLKYRIETLPEVEQDLDLVFDWYEAQEEGLGWRFLDEFLQYTENLASQGDLIRWSAPHAQVILPNFPYLIYFTIKGDTLIVLLLIHAHRDPEKMRRELLKRGKKR